MAKRSMWTAAEWTLLIDLVATWEDEVPEAEIEYVHRILRAAALTSEDQERRRQAADPSFRSLGAVRTQYYLVRRTRNAQERRHAPQRLRQAWSAFEKQGSEFGALTAREFREAVASESNPYGVNDRAALRLFLVDVQRLLGECVETLRTLSGSRSSADFVESHTAAWSDLTRRAVVADVIEQLEGRESEQLLETVGLTGAHLRWKLTGWLEAMSEWRVTGAVEALRRAFRWANVVLGSLGKVVAGPGLDIFKEFKEGTEAAIDEAVPSGGYLPAQAYA